MAKDDGIFNGAGYEDFPDDDDDIITLTTSQGEDVDFKEIAAVVYGGEMYVILQPVELLPDMNEDEALVFKMFKDENGDERFEIELDDDTVEAVFGEYFKLLDEQEDQEQ